MRLYDSDFESPITGISFSTDAISSLSDWLESLHDLVDSERHLATIKSRTCLIVIYPIFFRSHSRMSGHSGATMGRSIKTGNNVQASVGKWKIQRIAGK